MLDDTHTSLFLLHSFFVSNPRTIIFVMLMNSDDLILPLRQYTPYGVMQGRENIRVMKSHFTMLEK